MAATSSHGEERGREDGCRGFWPGFADYQPTHRGWRTMLEDDTRCLPRPANQRPCVVGGEDSLLGHVFGQQAELFVSVVCRTGGLRSVLMLSETCRLFRFLARDPMVWRELCLFAWSGEGRGRLGERLRTYGSWRGMFLDRPRLRFDGIYCFKQVIYRRGVFVGKGLWEGDPDGVGGYKPEHAILLARYVQLDPDGRAALLSSTVDLTPPAKVRQVIRAGLDHEGEGARSNRRKHAPKVRRSRNVEEAGPRVHLAGGKNGVVCVGTWHNDEGEISASGAYVLEDHPLMRPVVIDLKLLLHSSRPGANDRLTVVEHTTGGSGCQDPETLIHIPPPSRPFSFVPFRGWKSGFARVPGWEGEVEKLQDRFVV